jgi:hypothetical protein
MNTIVYRYGCYSYYYNFPKKYRQWVGCEPRAAANK